MGLDAWDAALLHLIQAYAAMRGRGTADVARAVLASRTLRHYGYAEAQNGTLTLGQTIAAAKLLNHWIGVEIGKHQ